ncbi:hypothetical protein [Fibrobacter sp.]
MLDKIDFSKMERITPREDSWSKVCARLDAKAKASAHKGNILSIRSLYSAIPLAASLVLVSLTAIFPAIESSTEEISLENVASEDITSWYNGLGNSTNDDDFETLEETVGFSYLTKE